jgi:pSer/pThr/pTyr-binding forkhead associated (FHA) protein
MAGGGNSDDRVAMVHVPDGKRHELRPGGQLRIGRHHENDIIVKASSVSRFHATIRWDADSPRPVLYDNGSQNGTHVNGKEVIGRAEPLPSRARVVIGPVTLTVEVAGSSVAPALIDDSSEEVSLFTDQGPELRGVLTEKDALRQLLLRLEVEERSGTLRVKARGVEARVTMATGKIMDVRCRGLMGLMALESLYEAAAGPYTFSRDMGTCDQPLNIRFSEFLRIRHGSHLGTQKWKVDSDPKRPTL